MLLLGFLRLIRQLAQCGAHAHALHVEATRLLAAQDQGLELVHFALFQPTLFQVVHPGLQLQKFGVAHAYAASSRVIVFSTQSCSTCLMRMSALYAACRDLPLTSAARSTPLPCS